MVGAVEQATDGGVVTVSPDALVRLCALAVEAGRSLVVDAAAVAAAADARGVFVIGVTAP